MSAGMIYNGTKRLAGEVIDLSSEIALVSPLDTPLYTMLANRGQIVQAKDITVTWREKQLDETRGTLIKEGAEAGSPIHSTRSMLSNLCQIMEKVTSVSGTTRAIGYKDIGDEFTAEVNDRLIECKRDCEYYFLNGVKHVEDETHPRQMDGLLNLVNSNNVIDLSAKTTGKGVITEADYLDALQLMWEKGSQGEYFSFVNAKGKRAVNDFLKSNANARIVSTVGDNSYGIMVNRIETDFGIINMVLDRYMPVDQILNVDINNVQIAELRPAFFEELAKTGDYTKGHVVCENTIKLLNSYSGSKLIGLGVTS